MSSTSTGDQPAPSGIVLPPGASRKRKSSWFRETRNRHTVFRAGVFIAGLLLVLTGAAMWLVSALLSAPPVFIGLWMWSREFHWGHRLFKAFLHKTRSLWSRAKARPLRWAIITVGGIGLAWAAYWAVRHYGPF